MLPDHFSNFSSSVLIRSSSDSPRSLESLEVELTEDARGGGLAGTISFVVSNSNVLLLPPAMPKLVLPDVVVDVCVAPTCKGFCNLDNAIPAGGGLDSALLLLCRLELDAKEGSGTAPLLLLLLGSVPVEDDPIVGVTEPAAPTAAGSRSTEDVDEDDEDDDEDDEPDIPALAAAPADELVCSCCCSALSRFC